MPSNVENLSLTLLRPSGSNSFYKETSNNDSVVLKKLTNAANLPDCVRSSSTGLMGPKPVPRSKELMVKSRFISSKPILPYKPLHLRTYSKSFQHLFKSKTRNAKLTN